MIGSKIIFNDKQKFDFDGMDCIYLYCHVIYIEIFIWQNKRTYFKHFN